MRAVLYARVSTPGQAEKDLSIPAQITEMENFCQRQGHQVVAVYTEPGKTARDDHRPEFQRMLSYAMNRENGINAIVVYATSRFYRNATQAGVARELLRRHGVEVISITQPIADDNAAGKFAVGLFGLIDELESNTIGERTALGMIQNARLGYYNGSTPPFGYRVAERMIGGQPRKMLEVDEEEAATIRRMFVLYVEGDSGRRVGVKRIVELLNSEDRFCRGKPWTKQRVSDRLCDETYIGEYYYNRKCGRTGRLRPRSEWVRIDIPPIIDQEQFEAAAKLRCRHRPSTTSQAASSPHLLVGTLVCGVCGAPMVMEMARGNGGEYRYYNCASFVRGGQSACRGNRLPMPQADRAVLKHIAEVLFTPERITNLIRALYARLRAQAANPEAVAEVKQQLTQTNSRIQRYLDLFEDGGMEGAELRERLEKLRREKSDLEERLSSMTAYSQVPPYVYTQRFQKSFRGQLMEVLSDSALARRYLSLFVSRIVAIGRELTVESRPEVLARAAVAAGQRGNVVPGHVLNWLPGADSNHQPTG